MFSGNIKSFVGGFWDETWAEFDDVFFYDLMLVFFLNGNYLFRWKKIDTQKYFKELTHSYITDERRILEKFRIACLIVVAVLLISIIVYGYSNPSEENNENDYVKLEVIFLFGILFISTITLMSCYYKIHYQDSKKHFRLFVSSGYFRKARKEDDEHRIESITLGLKWYNLHYKKKKKLHFKEFEKINLKLQDESRRNDSTILEDLPASLESGDENKALKIIAEKMKKDDLDLLEKDSMTTIVKGWIIPIATTVSAIGMVILVWINYQNIIQK